MFKKIGIKLIFVVVAATIAIISVYAFISIRSQSEVLIAEVERHSNQLSETIKSSTKYDMLLNRRQHILRIINTIGMQEFMKEIRIFDKEGTIIYSSNPASIGLMVDKKAEACYVCHAANEPITKLEISERTRIYRPHPDSARVLGIINAIYNEKSCWQAECHAHESYQTVLGVLDITVSLAPIDEKIASAKFKMLIFTIIAILAISLVLWYFVRKFVDKPVTELVYATKHVADGNLNYTIDTHGNDELGTLARSFNNMTKKLSEARRQLFQSDKMASLGRLAAGVAHEINNPLTGILTYSSFLLKRHKDDSALKEDLEVIVRETKRSREIVRSLLDFARQSVPKKNKEAVNDIIERAFRVINNQLSISHIKVNMQLAPQLPEIVVDANQIQQVIINLIVNAADAIGAEGGSITVATSLITLEPFGITHIKKALCPKGHDLMDHIVKIDGMPSIKFRAKINGNEGFVNIDPIYGKTRSIFGIKSEKNVPVEVYCPKCSIAMTDEVKKCPECGAKVYFFEVPGQGRLEGCTRKGCGWQYWKAAEEEGKKAYVEIKISDTGCGIPKENLEKIFEPFYSTKGQKGTGLGLAVIWGIVDNHDGTITVDSEVGKGTSFSVRLPVPQNI